MAKAGQAIYDGLLARGFTAPQAAALAGNMQQESGFDPKALNKASDAHGLMQWRLDRKSGLDAYAKATERDAGDIDTQLDYIVHEMQGNEAANAAAFLGAQDVASANAALKKYIRYGDKEGGKRLDYAMAFAGEPAAEAAPVPASGGNGFVNPAFSGQMPGVASFDGSPAAPAATIPGPDIAPKDESRLVPVDGPSDDDLLKAFLPPEPGAGDPAADSSAAPSDDDAFLKSFLTAPAAPSDGKKYVTQPDLSFVPGIGPLLNMAGYNGRPQEVDPGYEPSSVPILDPINAFATKALESVPIAGPALNSLAQNMDAGTYSLINRLTGQGGDVTAEDRAKINAADQAQNPVAKTAGEIAGNVGPLAGLGAAGIGAKLLGAEGPVLLRMAAGGTSGATIAGLDTLARGGTPEEAGKNALTGGVLGAAAPGVVKTIEAGANKLFSATSPAIAQLAKTAVEKFKIPVEAAQMSKNPLIKHAGDIVNKIPGLGGVAAKGKQIAAFNKALANEMGESAEALTPDVMQSAKDRISNVFEDVARRVPVVKADQQFQNELLQAVTDAESTLEAAKLAPITKQFDNIASTFKTGEITGDQYLSLTAKNSVLSKAIAQGGDIGAVASEMKDALFGALQRSAPKDVLADLTKARYQWKVMRTLENPAARSPTGEVSPAALMSVVVKNFGGKAFGKAGNMGELADIGQQLLKDPNSSQTAERGAVMVGLEKLLHSPLGAAGAVGAAALTPGVVPAVLGNLPLIAGGAVLSRMAAGGLRSAALTNRLIRGALTPANGNAATALSIGTQAASPMVARKQPIRITVNGGNRLLSGRP